MRQLYADPSLYDAILANGANRIVICESATARLLAALARYREAEVEVLALLGTIFPRGAQLPCAAGEAPEEAWAAIVPLCTRDALHNLALQVRQERSGRVVEVPLDELIGLVAEAEA